MISIDKLVEIGFTVSQATDISNFFRNIGYAAKFDSDDMVEGYNIPSNKIIIIDTTDTLKATFKADTQFYKDIECLLNQKGNTEPNKSNVNQVVVYQATGTDYGVDIDAFVKVNANWAQLCIDSRTATDIEKVAAKALSNNRLFVAQTSESTISSNGEDNVASKLAALNNDNVLLVFHKEDTESLATGLAAIMAQSQLGSVGSLYSTVTGVTPQDYDATTMNNLDTLNVSYYSEVNAINGGGVSDYASPILWGGYMINGEDAKRRYIRFALDLFLKAKSIDFLKKKLTYEDISAKILNSMLCSVLIEGQNNNLVKQDTETKKGFELDSVLPSKLQDTEPTLYNSQTYKDVGYYRDALTGRKAKISLFTDPADAELSTLLGQAA
ncbi:DUF3383 family protein [Spirochaetes bacterium]|uniref:DUF3383 family protein n=1 Tax=Candidatus Scatousia excrementipullorum TaxID=2840936 RepID=A0A9D9DPE4_9BACT|nr:DUF3383 family protein [Candidatus Scatousia excrementipullorum]